MDERLYDGWQFGIDTIDASRVGRELLISLISPCGEGCYLEFMTYDVDALLARISEMVAIAKMEGFTPPPLDGLIAAVKATYLTHPRWHTRNHARQVVGVDCDTRFHSGDQ